MINHQVLILIDISFNYDPKCLFYAYPTKLCCCGLSSNSRSLLEGHFELLEVKDGLLVMYI